MHKEGRQLCTFPPLPSLETPSQRCRAPPDLSRRSRAFLVKRVSCLPLSSESGGTKRQSARAGRPMSSRQTAPNWEQRGVINGLRMSLRLLVWLDGGVDRRGDLSLLLYVCLSPCLYSCAQSSLSLSLSLGSCDFTELPLSK